MSLDADQYAPDEDTPIHVELSTLALVRLGGVPGPVAALGVWPSRPVVVERRGGRWTARMMEVGCGGS